jgi:hypothetical protein
MNIFPSPVYHACMLCIMNNTKTLSCLLKYISNRQTLNYVLRIIDVKLAIQWVLSYFNFSTFIRPESFQNECLVVLGVVPDGAVSSATSAHHIQAVSMATVTGHPGSASVTRTGEEYCVIKV